MNWHSEWTAIASRIDGLLEAGSFFVRMWAAHQTDNHSVQDKELLPNARELFEAIREFGRNHKEWIPKAATRCLDEFVGRFDSVFKVGVVNGTLGLKTLLPALASFKATFAYHLSNRQFIAQRLTERAFVHLQSLIAVDPVVQQGWVAAFKRGETACEQRGATHLLLHGIWAFKAAGRGAATDLVLNEPMTGDVLRRAEQTAEASVLTEWKVVRNRKDTVKKAEQARAQADAYASGVLAGFELRDYRYLVLVSSKQLERPGDLVEGDITYRHINIAVAPETPSVTARRKGKR